MNVRLFSALYLQPFFPRPILLSGCYSAHCQRRVVSRSSTHTLHSETSKSYKMKSGKFTFGNRWSVLVVALLTFDSIQLISRLEFFPSLLLAPLCCFALLWELSPPALWFISVQLTLLLFFSLDFSFFYVQVLFFFSVPQLIHLPFSGVSSAFFSISNNDETAAQQSRKKSEWQKPKAVNLRENRGNCSMKKLYNRTERFKWKIISGF